MAMEKILLTLFVLTPLVPAQAAQSPFRTRPTVNQSGSRTTLSFELARPGDVEVAILDIHGNVVRHLAAGLVGGARAAEPLQAGALHQSLVWDGTDDVGKPVKGRTTIRVRTGLRAKLGRLIGGSPYRGRATGTPYRGSLQGVAVDEDGNVLVKMMSDVGSHGNSGLWPWQVRKFDSQGNYIKTLLPYPPSTNSTAASGYGLIESSDGHFTPVNLNSLYPVFSVFGCTVYPQVLSSGELVFVNSRARLLTFFKTDGSNAIRQIAMWPEEIQMPAPVWLDFEVAFSPDGRYAYYSNVVGTVYDGKLPDDINPKWPNGRVYRHDLSRPDSVPEPFYDLQLPNFSKQKYWMPSAWDKRTAAAGIDTDSDGNLYICDQVNQQVVVVSPDGKKTDAIELPWPDRVRVHPGTGNLYVVSRTVTRGYVPPIKLLKVVGRGAEAEIEAELAMVSRGNVEFTIAPRTDPPVLWVLAPGNNPSGQSLLRVEDRGDELAIVKDIFDQDHDAISFAGNLALDRGANRVYITDTRSQVFRYDGQTGEGGRIEMDATLLAVGATGNIVCVSGWHSPLASYRRGLEPLPVTDDDKHTFNHFYGRAGRGCSLGGLTIDYRGHVWALVEGGGMFVRAFQPDGTPVPASYSHPTPGEGPAAPAIIAGLDIHASCVRVDRQGNIYIGWLGLPEEHQPPSGYEQDEAYRRATGSVLKFGPEGGQRLNLKPDVKPPETAVMGFEGMKQIYPGLAPFSQWRCDGSCVCSKPRFDVDEFGRLYIPNAITFSVTVTDNAGNRLATFGRYGNFDAQGPGSGEPSPPIPMGWPTNAGVAGDHVYVADVLNHRVVRVDIDYADQAEVSVP